MPRSRTEIERLLDQLENRSADALACTPPLSRTLGARVTKTILQPRIGHRTPPRADCAVKGFIHNIGPMKCVTERPCLS